MFSSNRFIMLMFSFNEILKVRLAFEIYERNALRNDRNNAELVLQTIEV